MSDELPAEGGSHERMQATSHEFEDKAERLLRVVKTAGAGGVLLATHHNIAWMTGGRSNRIDASREAGTARLLFTPDGRRRVLANAIEMPRMIDEVLAGLGFEAVEYAWTDDQDPAFAVGMARQAIGDADVSIGADWPLPGTVPLEGAIARTRALLTEAEVERYRALGRDAGRALGSVCRELTPGDQEIEIARAVVHEAAGVRARAIVSLVGSDDRLHRYRHPVATAARWKHVVMVALCAERDGLVVSLSRIVAAGAPRDLGARTRATATVFARLLDATRPDATGAQLFDVAAQAYAAAGCPGEEQKHHQGGAIGYRAREWVAHPKSAEIVQARQAFAWNPTITGTKIEDTALVTDGRLEIITSTPDWPAIPLDTREGALTASDVWRI